MSIFSSAVCAVQNLMRGYNIQNAALFDGATGYLSRTNLTTSSTYTYSYWISRSNLGSAHNYNFSCGSIGMGQSSADQILMYDGTAPTIGTSVYRDTSAFTHVVYSVAAGIGTVYINGISVLFGPAGSLTTALNAMNIGRYNAGLNYYTNGYMAEFRLIDGQALTPSDFGEFDIVTGNWIAKKYTGTYGSNGLYLDFADSLNLGKDVSGNANNWTVNGTITQVTNTPTDVEWSWNATALNRDYPGILSNGNMTVQGNASNNSGERSSLSTPASGKWYAELSVDGTSGSYPALGVSEASQANNDYLDGYPGIKSTSWAYQANGQKVNNNTWSAYGASYAATDTIGIALDVDNGTLEFFKNGVSQGVAFTGIPATTYTFAHAGYATSKVTMKNEADWTYTAPIGFKALTTDNLPAITAINKNVDSHWKTVTYTGNGGTKAVAGLGFKPDFAWLKSRSGAYNHGIFDSIRGATKRLMSDQPDADVIYASTLVSFDSDGFTVGANVGFNTSGGTHVAWCANLPNTVTSGWAGSPTITPSKEIYNADLGMSIVHIAPGTSLNGQSVPHSLGVAPKMWMIKQLDGVDDWYVGHASIPNQDLRLNLTNAATARTWGTTATLLNLTSLALTGEFIIYLFAESDFIKIGSYTGNGSVDGPFVNTGISPVWALIKANAAYSWQIYDNARDANNPVSHYLFPDLYSAESVADRADFTANGLKKRTSSVATNTSGNTYVYMMIGQPTGALNAPAACGR